MGIVKSASIEKRALDPQSILHGAMEAVNWTGSHLMDGDIWRQVVTDPSVATASAGILAGINGIKRIGGHIAGAYAGTNLHKAKDFMLKPKNTWLQRGLLADSIIAFKKGVDGQSIAGRKPLGLIAFSDPETHMKLMGANHVNMLGKSAPDAKHLFDGEKLNVQRLKNLAESSADAKDMIRGGVEKRVARSTAMLYARLRREGLTEAEALAKTIPYQGRLHARLSEKTFPVMTGLDQVAKHHESLSANNGYGYQALERASSIAETRLSSPGLRGFYARHLYAKPDINERGIGRFLSNPIIEGKAKAHEVSQGIKGRFEALKDKLLKRKPEASAGLRTIDKAPQLPAETPKVAPIPRPAATAPAPAPSSTGLKTPQQPTQHEMPLPSATTQNPTPHQDRLLDRLNQVAHKYDITKEDVTADHVKRLADNLPSIRQDLVRHVERWADDSKAKVFEGATSIKTKLQGKLGIGQNK